MQATPAKSIGNEQDRRRRVQRPFSGDTAFRRPGRAAFPMAPVSGRLTTDGSDVDSPANHATVFTH